VGDLAGATRDRTPNLRIKSWIEECWSRRRLPPEVLLRVASYPSFRGDSRPMTSGLNVSTGCSVSRSLSVLASCN
jgi:hypothetical protein